MYQARRIAARVMKKLFRISDFSIFRSKLRKAIESKFYRRKYSTQDLIDVMVELGMKPGSTVCIHSASRQLYNYEGSLESFIDAVLDLLGPEGTLIMPAIPYSTFFEKGSKIFDVEKEASSSGAMTEIFRSYSGTHRSRLAQASAVALGKNAKLLIENHTLSFDPWDKNSPWYKMCELDALVFNIGMPRNYIGTFEHCVESLLRTSHPYWEQFFLGERKISFLDTNGIVDSHTYRTTNIPRVPDEPKIFNHLTAKEMRIKKISNLEIKVFYSKRCLNKMVDLGRKGISLYKYPSTKKFDWN